MQRRHHRALKQRMLYDWARLYTEQMPAPVAPGERKTAFAGLKPVVSIWVCEDDVFPQSEKAHLTFRLREVDERFALHDDLRVDILQLSRVRAEGTGLEDAALGGWCRLLNEAENWREIPGTLAGNPALEVAMSMLNEFRADRRLNALYRARLEYERVRQEEVGELEDERAARVQAEAASQTAQGALTAERAEKEAERAAKEAALAEKEAERAEKEAALAEKEAERAAKEAALAEVARLRKELADRGR